MEIWIQTVPSLQVAQWIPLSSSDQTHFSNSLLPTGQITLVLGEGTLYTQKWCVFWTQQYVLISLLADWLLLIADLLCENKKGLFFFLLILVLYLSFGGADIECCNLTEIYSWLPSMETFLPFISLGYINTVTMDHMDFPVHPGHTGVVRVGTKGTWHGRSTLLYIHISDMAAFIVVIWTAL